MNDLHILHPTEEAVDARVNVSAMEGRLGQNFELRVGFAGIQEEENGEETMSSQSC